MAAGRYYRVSPMVWHQPWNDDTRLAALYVLTCEHRTLEGLFRMPLSYAATDLGWQAKRFERAFGDLMADGFVEYDPAAHVCLIVNALEWQSPTNPNQVTAAVKKLRELPHTPLFDRLTILAAEYCPRLVGGLAVTFPGRVAHALAEVFPDGLPERVAQALPEALPEAFGEAFPYGFPQPPAPAPAPAPSVDSPAVVVGDTSANGRATTPNNERDPNAPHVIAEDVLGVLQRGIDGLTDDAPPAKRPTAAAILLALREHQPTREDALGVAIEVRSIAQSQNKAPNIAALYAKKLAAKAGVAA